MADRARHGDAPRWVLVHVLATFLGITLAVIVYSTIGVLAHWNDAPSPGPFVSAAVTLVLLSLLAACLRHRPLTRVDRTYYRLATLVIGIYGLMGTWQVGAVVAAALLALSFLLDREARPTAGPQPVTRDAAR